MDLSAIGCIAEKSWLEIPGHFPIITIAWLGIKRDFQGKGFGERLLACALSDCYNAAQNIPVVAVMLDC